MRFGTSLGQPKYGAKPSPGRQRIYSLRDICFFVFWLDKKLQILMFFQLPVSLLIILFSLIAPRKLDFVQGLLSYYLGVTADPKILMWVSSGLVVLLPTLTRRVLTSMTVFKPKYVAQVDHKKLEAIKNCKPSASETKNGWQSFKNRRCPDGSITTSPRLNCEIASNESWNPRIDNESVQKSRYKSIQDVIASNSGSSQILPGFEF